jgi:hypothetical protein
MAVEKISISIDEELVVAARAAAEAEGMSLSAWLSRAATEAVAIEAGKQGVREFVEENGPFPEEAKRWAADVMDRHGVGRR